jgi:hypothetical protein
MRDRFFPDQGSPTQISELCDKFLGKSYYNSSSIGSNFYSLPVKKKINFVVVGSGIRDPVSDIRDPGWIKIRIGDKHPGYATQRPNQ